MNFRNLNNKNNKVDAMFLMTNEASVWRRVLRLRMLMFLQ